MPHISALERSLLNVMLSPNFENFLGRCRLRCGLVVSSKGSEGSELMEDVSELAVSLGTEEGGRGSPSVMVEDRSESCLASCTGCTVRGFFEGVEGPLKSSY